WDYTSSLTTSILSTSRTRCRTHLIAPPGRSSPPPVIAHKPPSPLLVPDTAPLSPRTIKLFKPLLPHILLPGSSNWVCLATQSMTERTGLTPDPADPEGLRHAVTQQGTLLDHQSNALQQLASTQQDMFCRIDNASQAVMDLTSQLAKLALSPTPPLPQTGAAAASATSHENIRLQPEAFHGDVEACGGFLFKITLIINSLRGKALQWAQAYLFAHPISVLTYDHFQTEFKLVFDQPRKEDEATRRLLNLKQGKRTVADHVIDFRILAVEAGWPDPALKGIFYQSLSEFIKDHLCSQPEARSFEELVSAALRSDVRLKERQTERHHLPRKAMPDRSYPVMLPLSHSPVQEPTRRTGDEPMQIGHSKLTPEERQRRRDERSCFYCGKSDHYVAQCPLCLKDRTPR
uniref:CCHC-type domain-containing protein n=1 Tax=Oryzias melastigma TaxID=30732 RepID=A0A3B3D0F0_ORYME